MSVPHARRFAPLTAEAAVSTLSSGAGGETKVPRFARNDKRDAGKRDAGLFAHPLRLIFAERDRGAFFVVAGGFRRMLSGAG